MIFFLALLLSKASKQGLIRSIVVEGNFISDIIVSWISILIIGSSGSTNQSSLEQMGIGAGCVQLIPTAGSRGIRAAARLVVRMSWVVVSKPNNKTVCQFRKKIMICLGRCFYLNTHINALIHVNYLIWIDSIRYIWESMFF